MNRKQRPTETPGRWSARVPFDEFELRAADDGALSLHGYATVFGAEYEMYGGPPYGWTESVEAGAFDETLAENPDVVLLVNHEGLPLARTKSKTLTLASDSRGLLVEADLDNTDPDVSALAPKMTRGDVDEMSFAFRVTRHEWDEELERRWIRGVNINRGDVSVVTFGANPHTEVDLRTLLAQDQELVMAELRGIAAESPDLLTKARALFDSVLSDGKSEEETSGGMPRRFVEQFVHSQDLEKQ